MSSITKLKENYLFRRVYTHGKSFMSPFFVIYVCKNRSRNVRMGITVGKKIGGAVLRNRAKRVIVAAFRGCYPHIEKGFDFVIVARPRILNIKSNVAEDWIKKLLITANVWNGLETDGKNTD